MKLNKALIAFSFLFIGLTGCNTDDLEKDIDALKDRVASMETQVQALNESMNILRIALEGNKTIQKCTDNGDGSLTLLLSDGSSINLTQGVEGSEFYPTISIDGDGFWMIDGVKQEYKAKAEDGQDGKTPKFRLDSEGDKFFWAVSFDDGKTFEPLLDTDGNRVQANVEESILPSNDGPITNVEVNGNSLKFSLDGNDYSIPIVEGLKCIVTIPDDSKEGEYCIVSTRTPLELDIEVSGEYCLVNAPAGWSASVNKDKTKLTIDAPEETDKEGIIILQVNKGINWAVEKIKVKSKYVVSSYLEEYNAGYDIQIADVVINNKSGYSVANDGKVIQNGGAITGTGIHFIAADAVIKVPSTINVNELILICDRPKSSAIIMMEDDALFTINSSSEKGCLLSKNIRFVVNPTKNTYMLNVTKCMDSFKLISDNCKYEIASGKNYSYSTTEANIAKICFRDCDFYFDGDDTGTVNSNIIGLSKVTVKDAVFENNLFTTKTKTKLAKMSILLTKEATVTINNNTFFNAVPANNLVKTIIVDNSDNKKWTIKNNIFYSEIFKGTTNLISATQGTSYGDENELRYSPNITNYAFRYFATSGGKPDWVVDAGKYQMDKTTTPIFDFGEQTDMTEFDFASLIEGFGCSKR